MKDGAAAITREREFRRAYDQYGAQRFELGVTAAIDRHNTGFFPSCGEFIDYIPTHIPGSGVQSCPRCESTGIGRYIEKRMVNGKFYDFAVKCDHKPVEVQE